MGNNGFLLVGSRDHSLHAIDTNTGKAKWVKDLGGSVTTPVKGEFGTLYVASRSSEKKLFVLNENSGEIKGEIALEGKLTNPPLVWKNGDKTILFAGDEKGKMYALEVEHNFDKPEIVENSDKDLTIKQERKYIVIGGVKVPIQEK